MEKLKVIIDESQMHGGLPRREYEDAIGEFEKGYTPAPFYNGSKEQMIPARSINMQGWNRRVKDFVNSREPSET